MRRIAMELWGFLDSAPKSLESLNAQFCGIIDNGHKTRNLTMIKQHPLYNNILVGQDGTIYSTGKNYKQPRKLKPYEDERGYARVNVQVGVYNQKRKAIHRLVAETYLPNPHNLLDVHHKDNNPRNNNLDNLEWTTHKKNCEYSRDNIGQNKSMMWKILNVKTGEIFIVKNLSKWCQENDLNRANLHKTLKTNNQHKGYRILERISSESFPPRILSQYKEILCPIVRSIC